MVTLMTDMKIKVSSQTWAMLMSACLFHKQYKLSEEYFNVMIESGVEPTPHAWTELIKAKAEGMNSHFGALDPPPLILSQLPRTSLTLFSEILALDLRTDGPYTCPLPCTDLGPDAALEQVNILQRTGVTPTIEMFTWILHMFVNENRHQDSNDLWMRMHWEECQLDTASFSAIMKLCSKTGIICYQSFLSISFLFAISPLYSFSIPSDSSDASSVIYHIHTQGHRKEHSSIWTRCAHCTSSLMKEYLDVSSELAQR
jgi:pentatricopeptide repeat protein